MATTVKDIIMANLINQRNDIYEMMDKIAAGDRKDGDPVMTYPKRVFADNAEFFRQQGFDVWQDDSKTAWYFAPKTDIMLTEDELAFAEMIGEAQEESRQEESGFPFGDIPECLRDMIGGLPDILSELPGRVKVHSIGIIPVGSPSEFFSMMREAMGIPNDEAGESKTDPADTDQKMKEETPAEDDGQEDPAAEDGDQEDPEAQTDEPGEPAE